MNVSNQFGIKTEELEINNNQFLCALNLQIINSTVDFDCNLSNNINLMKESSNYKPRFAIKYQEKYTSSGSKPSCQGAFYSKRMSNSLEKHGYERMQSLDVYDTHMRSKDEHNKKSLQQLQDDYLKQQSNALTLAKALPSYYVNKSLPRISISLFDEELNGGVEQRIRGRVVYRNNMAKNSYYLMSNLRQLANRSIKKSKNYSENELEFNSKFESGNASSVVRVSKSEYYVFMREDTNTHGLRQWFYFLVTCNRPIKAHIRIYKFNKKYLLYREGMKPYIKTEGEEWKQRGDNVSYCYDEELKCYYLAFTYTFVREGQSIEVANMPPYTYSKLLRFLSSIRTNSNVKIENIGYSLGGVEIPLVKFIAPKATSAMEQVKRCIVILGRTHPSQTCSNFTIEALAESLLKCQSLLSVYDIFVVPMVNPDGVIVGNHRTSLIGMDLNRKFSSNTLQMQMFPEAQAVKNLIKNLLSIYHIDFLFDFHGHSARRNIFAYAEEESIGNDKYLKSRIIPKLLSQLLPSFKYNYCIFEEVRQKKSTARVYFRSKYAINSITFEQSYGLLDKSFISIDDWMNFGKAFVQALTQFITQYQSNLENMKERLSQEIKVDQRREEIKREKCNKSNELQKNVFISQQNEAKYQRKCEIQDQSKEEEESLDSGDQALEITEEEIDFIQKNLQIQKRENKQRELLELNDMSIELQPQSRSKQRQSVILHEQKMPLISRIMRMKEKQRVSRDLISILTQRHPEQKLEVGDAIRNKKIRLPSLSRYNL